MFVIRLVTWVALLTATSEALEENGLMDFPDCDFDVAGILKCHQKPSLPGAVRIACVGDSITAGLMASDRSKSYPSQLQMMLDEDYGPGHYSVTNLGASGYAAEMLSDLSYWHSPQFQTLATSTWDVIIIMLGTNDSKEPFVAQCAALDPTLEGGCTFADDLRALIDFSTKLGTNPSVPPKVYVMIPPPLMTNFPPLTQEGINSVLPRLVPLIQHSSTRFNTGAIGLIDMFSAMGGSRDWVSKYPVQCFLPSTLPSCRWYCDSQSCDQVHPNDAGYHHMAVVVEAQLMLGLGAGQKYRQLAVADGATLV